MDDKKPFDIGLAMRRIRTAVRPWPKAALFELAEDGFKSTFEQLVACIISIRTYDEVTLPVVRKLFGRARTPAEISKLSYEELDALINLATFHERKAIQILEIARRAVDEYDGNLPCHPEILMSFAGVGPKCANLVLGIACGEPFISVDIHVHRVTDRWGYVQASTPEKTLLALESKLLPASEATSQTGPELPSARDVARVRDEAGKRALEVGKAAVVEIEAVAAEAQRARGDALEQAAIVRDEQHGGFETAQGLL